MSRWIALVLALVTAPAWAAIDVDLKPYVDAERAGAGAGVSGRVYAEARTPTGPESPLAGATVVAVPRSEALVRRLEALRAGARESAQAYRDAALLMQRAREGYEKDLWDAGAPDLVRTAVVDAAGRFDFGRLPEGRWLVVGIWDELVHAKGQRTPRKDRDLYVRGPSLVGFRARLVWLRDIAVTRTDTPPVELTDRNAWFRGVVEDRVLDTGSRH